VLSGGVFKESGVCNGCIDLVVEAVKVEDFSEFIVVVIITGGVKVIEMEEDTMNSPGGILEVPVIISSPLLPTIYKANTTYKYKI